MVLECSDSVTVVLKGSFRFPVFFSYFPVILTGSSRFRLVLIGSQTTFWMQKDPLDMNPELFKILNLWITCSLAVLLSSSFSICIHIVDSYPEDVWQTRLYSCPNSNSIAEK